MCRRMQDEEQAGGRASCLADDAMAAFTGKLLALVGPLDEHHIAFTRSPAYTSGTLSSPKEVPRS